MEIKAIVYARVSTKTQNLDTQLQEIKRYTDYRKIDVVNIYTDKQSGKNTDREGWNKVISDLTTNPLQVKALVVYKLDRIGRSIKDLINIVDFLRTHNIDLIAISSNIDTTTKEGRLFFYIMSAFAEYERELIQERVTMGREYAIEHGAKIGRPKTKVLKEQVELLLNQGVPKSEIARQFKIHRGTIYNILGGK